MIGARIALTMAFARPSDLRGKRTGMAAKKLLKKLKKSKKLSATKTLVVGGGGKR
jgi:hypothetical protein